LARVTTTLAGAPDVCRRAGCHQLQAACVLPSCSAAGACSGPGSDGPGPLLLDIAVAVRLDADALLASVGQELSDLGRVHLARGHVHDLEADDGGVGAMVGDPDQGLQGVWVGVVDGGLTGECDCADGAGGRLCGHAVAVALAALEEGFSFASVASRAGEIDPEEQRFAEVAAGLPNGELVRLVARQAVDDRYFAALLLATAGQLPAPGPAEIAAARRTVAAAEAVPDGRNWDLYDLVKAGTAMQAELELLALRPPTAELLVVIEEAIAVWATLSGYLNEAWEIYETEPQEIGAALAELHHQLCQACRPDPLELEARLATLVGSADGDIFLDAPERYADILGTAGEAEFRALTGQRF